MGSYMRFKDKVAVITGAAQGIGRAIAIAFASEGANLCLIDLDKYGMAELLNICDQEYSTKTIIQTADVSQPEEMDLAVSRTVDAFGKIDILVNNAGILPDGALFEEIQPEDWERIFGINFFGVVNGCRSVIPTMKKNRSGRIINASSMYGLVPQYRSAPYCATKSAIISITRVLASELGPYGVTVNAYAPGATRTKLAAASLSGERGIAKLREIPMGRFAEPEDIANGVIFLASEEASFVNGHILLIDGGTLSIQSPLRVSIEHQ